LPPNQKPAKTAFNFLFVRENLKNHDKNLNKQQLKSSLLIIPHKKARTIKESLSPHTS